MSLFSLTRLRTPRGLPARAVLFTTLLVVVTAVVSTATVLFGAQREGDRREIAIARDLTESTAHRAGHLLVSEDRDLVVYLLQSMVRTTGVRSVVVHDASGNLMISGGLNEADAPLLMQLSRQALEAQGTIHQRGRDGGLFVAAPIVREGVVIGTVGRIWERQSYSLDLVTTLAPVLVVLACLILAAVVLTARFVRRAISPLNDLAHYAKRVAEHGRSEPLVLKTGDEFETLANAFNEMTSRLDSSIRQIQEIAFVDPITRLPNQERFKRELDYLMLQQSDDPNAAVLVLEFQRLPKLMQTLDPDATRNFLRVIAERFTSSVSTVDKIVRRGQGKGAASAARLSGAEFAVSVPGLSQADAARFVQHLNAALNQPFEWRGHKLMLGACCGVALAPRDGRDADTVIRHARMALSAAPNGAAKVKLYTQSLDREAVASLTLEREMRGALERNEFRAYFQPKINLATGRIEGCEALARWIRPDRTIISPGRFIPVAEETGLIGALSDAIMREACWKAAAWARAGQPAKVAVNVSALQFRSDRFAENVLRIVQHAGLAPSLLELEITETVALEDPDRALRVIQPLREAGVRLAIDDFGCGHSSLAALSKLPFDVIKIDQTFIRALERGDAQTGAIVEMILALARTLDLEVVAEGVERGEEAEFMAARGCHWVQGFLYGAAVSAPEFAELLRRQSGDDVMAIDAA